MIFNAVILGLLATVGLVQAASVKRQVYQGYGEHFLNYDMYPQKREKKLTTYRSHYFRAWVRCVWYR
jgi:hypothetical protein